jgi:hypothetical protein
LRIIIPLLLCVGLTFSTFSTLGDYFNNWAARTGNFISFDTGYLTLAQKLRARSEPMLYLSPVEREHYTIQFGLAGRQASSFDGRRVLVLSDAPAAYGIVTAEDDRLLGRLRKFFPRDQVVDTIYDWTGKPYAAIFQTTRVPVIAPAKSVKARFGEAIQLMGYDATRTANEINLTIYWNSMATMPDDYTVFVQLIGTLNPATQSPVWAQVDRRPGEGSYPTQHWQSGEIIIDDYRLKIPANARGEFEIHVGMYDLKTGARIRVNDAPKEQDYVILERLALP